MITQEHLETVPQPGAVPQALEIREAAAGDEARWNAFVHAHAHGTFFHLFGWKTVLERAFRHPTHFLLAESDGVVRGVLPLGHVRSLLFGNALVSTPFAVYGGVLAADDTARERLIREATALAAKLKVDHLEIRERRPVHPDWLGKDLYVTFRKTIEPDPEANLQAIPRKQRRMVRKGIGSGLVSELDPEIDRFYAMYSESVRNLGTPVFSRRYFRVLQEVFGDDCEVLVVTHRGVAVAGVMNFYFRDEVLPYYGGGTDAARALAANDFMYWEVMRRACERGLRTFDFGRSKREVGSYRFKKHWGFDPEPLHYAYNLVRATAVPDVNPLNPKYRIFVETWKKLPLPLSRLLGPLLSRSLG